jgi:LysM repeat protein
MAGVVETFRSLRRPAAVLVTTVGIAGCSADSTRFNDSLFGKTTANDYTGSATVAPVPQVQESRLPPPMEGQLPSNGARQTVAYAPAVHSGMAASTQATGTRPGHHHEPGRQLGSNAALGGSGVVTAAGPTVHVVGHGETLSKIARHYHRSVSDIARANNIEPHTALKVGDRLAIPASNGVKGKGAVPVQNQPIAASKPTETASVASPVPDAPVAPSGAKPTSEAPSLRWPVKGRVIAGFGPKTNGQQNDGINLSVPEGTPIKAAEDGVVAYAGNELKGYGNLVLVRHPNGYVTAYAHAKELMVKRGDEVKRGQIIAKSGQTGNVDAPQLHFEVRKGQAPVDPMPLLSGG